MNAIAKVFGIDTIDAAQGAKCVSFVADSFGYVMYFFLYSFLCLYAIIVVMTVVKGSCKKKLVATSKKSDKN